MIAALYVCEKGIYAGRANVAVWGITRDARRYNGPHPVVAHPPCNLWTNFAALNYARYQKPELRPGNDGGCFQHALACVRSFGGVLEHPASSKAWNTYGLPKPKRGTWTPDGALGWTTELDQAAYGHRARKRTWLYYAGDQPPPPMLWQPTEGSHQIGWFDRNKPTLSKTESSATPPEFAEVLIQLACTSKRTSQLTSSDQVGAAPLPPLRKPQCLSGT